MNVSANYFANRAELGFSHYGNFENTFGSSLAQHSSIRFGTSLAYADGAMSVGRPIYDSFAIVQGHPSLDGASIEVEPTPLGHIAETGALGSPTHPNLPAFLSRTISIEAPDAPPTADLGQGTFRVLPPCRSGYLLVVGSAYDVSAVGRLLNSEGAPVALMTGTAALQGGNDGPDPIAVFTSREGRFRLTGLGPGRWLIRMNDEFGSTFLLDIAGDAEGIIRLGELRPTTRVEQETP